MLLLLLVGWLVGWLIVLCDGNYTSSRLKTGTKRLSGARRLCDRYFPSFLFLVEKRFNQKQTWRHARNKHNWSRTAPAPCREGATPLPHRIQVGTSSSPSSSSRRGPSCFYMVRVGELESWNSTQLTSGGDWARG